MSSCPIVSWQKVSIQHPSQNLVATVPIISDRLFAKPDGRSRGRFGGDRCRNLHRQCTVACLARALGAPLDAAGAYTSVLQPFAQ